MAGPFSKLYDAKWIILGILLVLLIIWIAWPFFDVFIYGIFIYYITKPIKARLQPYIRNESLLVVACLLLLVLPLILILAYTLLVGISEFNSLVRESGVTSGVPMGPLSNLSITVSQIQQNLTYENLTLDNISGITEERWYQVISGFYGSISGLQVVALATGATILDIIFRLFLIFVVAFYLLRDDDRFKAWFASTSSSLMDEHDGIFRKYFQAVDRDLEKIFFGNVLSIVFIAIIAMAIYSVINLFAPDATLTIPYPLLMGILTGISAFVPAVGMWLVLGPLFIYIFLVSLIAGTLLPNIWYFIAMVLAVTLFVEVLPDYAIRPFIARGKVHTGLLMFAYILGPIVFGVSGLFLGAIVLVLITNYFKIVYPAVVKGTIAAH